MAITTAVGAATGVAGYAAGKHRRKKKTEKTDSEPVIPHRQGFYEKYIKRPQDFCCALLAIIVLSPVMLVTALLVRVKLGSPVLFTQERPGLNGKIFKLYKFRTMTDEKNENGELLPDDDRLTRFGKALRSMENGLAINPLIAKAIAMGDEFHQRNIAASLVFLKEMAPLITEMKDISEKDRYDVIKFLADTDQFFLNIMMATGKAVMDDARKGTDGTIVTAMCRNGYEFGIRIAGMGDEWFTGPVNTPQGLYFTGYDADDACPDMGDSAITETFGVGGMAMIAAPAVTRFVGAGGYEDALRTSNEMMEIVTDRNPNFTVPTWNFQGICLGIDARLVVEKGITPVINTGIANKVAGKGQIGAGTVHPPIECFEKAIVAYAKKLGFEA